MTTVKPERAPRNRTLTLNDADRIRLTPFLHSADAAGKCGETDMVINADLDNCLDRIPDGVADLIIADPPYNISKDFGAVKFAAMDENAYEAYLDSWTGRLCRKLKPGGSMYMCGDWRCSSAIQRVLSRYLTVINRITWQREKGRGARSNWKNSMEDIWFAVKNPRDYYFDLDAVKTRPRVMAPYRSGGNPKDWEDTADGRFRMTCPSNFWDDISVPFWSMPENTDHPTQKPEKLYAKLILASSRPGDLVLDPFQGSGTAAVVARKLGRRFCGIEINREYCLWALRRLEMAVTDSSIQGYADGVFWERNSGPRR